MPFIDAKGLTVDDGYTLLSAIVVPRPIAWITSVDRSGRVNAAPFSCYTYVSNRPPMIAINIGRRDGTLKDTARNVHERGTFVVNVVTEDLVEAMHRSSFDYPPEVSEPEVLGLRLAPSSMVDPPRLADVPIALECKLYQSYEFGEQRNELVIGEIVCFAIDERVLAQGRIDIEQFRPPGRIGGPNYSILSKVISMPEMGNPEQPPSARIIGSVTGVQ